MVISYLANLNNTQQRWIFSCLCFNFWKQDIKRKYYFQYFWLYLLLLVLLRWLLREKHDTRSSNSKQFYVYYLLKALVYLLSTLISDQDFNSLSDNILLCQNINTVSFFVSRKLTEESLSCFDVLWSINISGQSHLNLSFIHGKDQRWVYLTVIFRFFLTSVLRGEIILHE